jgi:threonine dehydrogenase-like Zn-dependent dehydrogenase
VAPPSAYYLGADVVIVAVGAEADGNVLQHVTSSKLNQCPVKRQWPRLFEHIRNGYLKPSDIVTHRIPLEHIAEGYHMFSAKLDNIIKPLVVAGQS